MGRRWNLSIWVGFLIVLSAPFTYLLLFIRFPASRDFPWATLLVFGVGFALLARGLIRAYREPQLHRGKIAGSILMILGIALLAFFGFGILYLPHQLPPSTGAPQAGQKAPDFTLPDQDGRQVTLSTLLESGSSAGDRVNGVLLIFYRGYW